MTENVINIEDRLIDEKERRRITGISKTTWWRRERQGLVPRKIRGIRKALWRLSDIQSWIKSI